MTTLEISCEMKQKLPFCKKKTINANSQLTLFPIPCALHWLPRPSFYSVVPLKGSEIISVLWSGTFKECTQYFACRKQNIIDRSGACMWPCTTASIQHPAMRKINQKTRGFTLQKFNVVMSSHRVEMDCCMFVLLYAHLALDLQMLGFKLMYQSHPYSSA